MLGDPIQDSDSNPKMSNLWSKTFIQLEAASNYENWSTITQSILIHEGLWYTIAKEEEVARKKKTYEEDNEKARAMLNLLVQPHICQLVKSSDYDDARNCWNRLATLYNKKTNANLNFAVRSLKTMTSRNFPSISAYTGKFEEHANKIAELLGGPLPNPYRCCRRGWHRH